MKRSELKEIIKEIMLNESSDWIPSMKEQEFPINKLTTQIAKNVNYDNFAIYGIAVGLLEEVNEHKIAKKLNDMLLQEMK